MIYRDALEEPLMDTDDDFTWSDTHTEVAMDELKFTGS